MFATRTNWNLAHNRFAIAVEEQKKSGKPLLDLTASNPTACGFEYPTEKILGSLTSPSAMKYEPLAQGLPLARQAVADYYSSKSLSVSADDLILATSTSEAYSFILRLLCEPGDSVLIPRPSYPLFEFLANIQDVHLIPYPLIYDHGWQIDFVSLHSAITTRTRAIIVVNPNNPTGSFLKQAELDELNRLCSQHDLALISDEVFHDYSFDHEPKASVAGNHEVLSFTLSGLSKVAGLPQMKVAWMAVDGPTAVKKEALSRLDVIADTYLSMNAPIQHALPALLESRHDFQNQLNARLRNNLGALDRLLAQQKACTRLEVEGGWYAILRVPVTRSDEDLAVSLLQNEGVLVHPGHFFDFEQEGYLILSLMTPGEVFAAGVRRALSFVSSN